MEHNNKYKIIKDIPDDAPFGDVNWYTASFLTPSKIEKTKYLDVHGFKVHTGYNSLELAKEDSEKIKKDNPRHDVYVGYMGKKHAWDDATKTDNFEYADNKLNEMEKTRKENIDKLKLVAQQLNNEKSIANIHDKTQRQRKRLQAKLLERGIITKKEYDLVKDEANIQVNDVKKVASELELIDKEIEECYKTDYLDENPKNPLKYGIISIYSPKKIANLKILFFKVRGLFQTKRDRAIRVHNLKKLYPDDPIYIFNVGQWNAYSYTKSNDVDPLVSLKQLNYIMKCHIDNMAHEQEEFEKRKDSMQKLTDQESKKTQKEAKKEKKKNQKNKTKETKAVVQSKETEDFKDSKVIPESLGINNADNESIQKLINYLDDSQSKNKFAVDKSTLQTVQVDVC